MSIIMGQGIRNASVVAVSPVIATAFWEVAFREYVYHQNLEVGLSDFGSTGAATVPALPAKPAATDHSEMRQVTLEHLPARTAPRRRSRRRSVQPDPAVGCGSKALEGRGSSRFRHTLCRCCSPGVSLISEAEFRYLQLARSRPRICGPGFPPSASLWEVLPAAAAPGSRQESA